ncbi:unnamed protein product [Tetraodon nigroviridis]|uniref:(spotted green pufferfish) hypothetical protein n=1 Tax=Tetraodon nigroviridis TaxID=99883 RepID=Q4RXB2_TETNG|nr:unnamed protein product [Tetraodon nigroviridis]
MTCFGGFRFPDDAVVSFSEVQGMTELNGLGPVKIKNLSDSKCLSWLPRLHFSERIIPVILHRLLQHWRHFGLFGVQMWWHGHRDQTASQILQMQKTAARRAPKPIHNKVDPFLDDFHLPQADADALVAMVRELNEVARLEQLDEFAVRSLAYTARGDLAPVNAFIGGLAAQEVIKACSRKFIPLQQWLYCDAFECLPENGNQQAERSSSTDGTRYDGQTAVFGSAFQEKLAKQKYFLVGAGAIGCELLKNFALMGLGASEDGHITVTDMDRIEKSNLNRQFLFRSQDIGEPKSKTAAKAVGEINPQMNITAHQNRLDPDSEDVYDYHFFTGLDGWARNQFEGHFKQNPENMNLFLNDVEFVDRTLSHGDAEALEVLEGVWNCLEVMTAGGKRPTSWEDCVTWARSEWETLFNHKICQLLHNVFPDKTTHMDYVVAAANLYAQIYGLEGTRDRTSITQILDHLVVPPFVSTSSIKIDLTKKEEEEEEKECDDYEKARLKELKELLSLPSVRASALQMHPTDFEKSKRIAGKIIPAIATTTAAVAGLMCLELYKLVQGHRDISSYCTSFFNLSSQYFVWSRPTRAKRFTGARINSDQVASDTPDSTIGEFYMTVELLFWKADRDRKQRTVISGLIYTLFQVCSVEEGEKTQQRDPAESSSEIHLCRITVKLLHFHFPGEICGTFQ